MYLYVKKNVFLVNFVYVGLTLRIPAIMSLLLSLHLVSSVQVVCCSNYRVIGTWDCRAKALKCAKVRESTRHEEECNDRFIKISDSAMREFTCSISEQ